MTTKSTFCSQCKKSTYLKVRGKNMLRCAEFSHPELDDEETLPHENEELLPPCWTYAKFCPFFEPEKREYKTRRGFRKAMQECDIPLEEEQLGILAHVKLK